MSRNPPRPKPETLFRFLNTVKPYVSQIPRQKHQYCANSHVIYATANFIIWFQNTLFHSFQERQNKQKLFINQRITNIFFLYRLHIIKFFIPPYYLAHK